KVMSPGGTFKSDLPTTQQAFPNVPGVGLAFQPTYAHTEWSVYSDTRNHRSYPTHGGLYRVAATTFNDQSTGTFTFQQYEAEALQLVPLTRRWILAFRGWVVGTDVGTGHEIPFYLLPSLGGSTTLRGYSNYRFHDQNLALANAESRWAIFTHLDGAVFFDAGNVAPT